jgi:uncharacterized protein YwqG
MTSNAIGTLARILGVLLLALVLYSMGRPNFHPLDQSLQLARRWGLAESVVGRAKRLARPGLHLEHTGEARFSSIGGLPSVPPDFEWPTWQGRPLGFVAQLDLEEVAAGLTQPWLPKRGQLYFFFVSDQSVGGYGQEELGAWRVIHTNAERTALVPATMPAGLEQSSLFPRTNLRFRRIDTLPTADRFMEGWDLSNEEFEALLSARGALFREQPRHQMFGYPFPEQDDRMELEAQLTSKGVFVGNPEGWRDPRIEEASRGYEQWRLLLQIDTDDDLNMMWQDGGLLYFWIREEDAVKGNFGAVWTFLQSG